MPSLRRARPLLGTLVEIGVIARPAHAQAIIDLAFATIAQIQACLSRFEASSDIARFRALPANACMAVRKHTTAVLAAACELRDASEGLFDISLGTGACGWHCAGGRLHKDEDGVELDLGGIAKGYAVDCAVQALVAHGCSAGWVNAGGDLRAFGDIEVPLMLRNETIGGTYRLGSLADGAFATSRFDADSRSCAYAKTAPRVQAHVSVAAPYCVWADALTKIVALSRNPEHPLVARFGGQAWLH